MKTPIGFIVLISLLICMYSNAQSKKERLLAGYQSYEVQCEGYGNDGTQLIKVWGYGKDVEDAKLKCKMNAVHAVLFRGISAGKEGCQEKPLVSGAKMNEHEQFFEDFFQPGGQYLNYVNYTNDVVDAKKIGRKQWKAGVVVSVNYNLLRKYLQDNNIMQAPLNIIPTMMVVPSYTWCNEKGYLMEIDNQGVTDLVKDYERAKTDSELEDVVLKIQQMLLDFGYDDFKDLVAYTDRAKKNYLDYIAEGIYMSFDAVLAEVARTDILLETGYTIGRHGPNKSINMKLQAIDVYTSTPVAVASGYGEGYVDAPMYKLIEAALNDKMNEFTAQITEYMIKLQKEGRRVSFTLAVSENADVNLEDDECDGEYFADVCFDFFSNNCVDGVFTEGAVTESTISYMDVMMPLIDERGNRTNVRRFVRDLEKKIESCGYNASITSEGLGKAIIIIKGFEED